MRSTHHLAASRHVKNLHHILTTPLANRIPFYAYLRLLFLLYLVLPQTQGAKIIYQERIHPYLEENEAQIEEFIARAHDRLKAAGIAYLKRAIELLKTKVFGLPPDDPTPPAPEPPPGQSYTQTLLARFSLPAARWSSTGNTGADFYNFLAGAMSTLTTATGTSTGGATGAGTMGMTASGTLIPPNLRGADEKMTFIAAQRERLNIVLGVLDREAKELERAEALRAHNVAVQQPRVPNRAFDGGDDSERPPSGLSGFSVLSGLSKSRSEADFEKIDAESGAEDESAVRRRNVSGGGSWLPWGWAAAATPSADVGHSSAVEKEQ